jgi:hypothetical protein
MRFGDLNNRITLEPGMKTVEARAVPVLKKPCPVIRAKHNARGSVSGGACAESPFPALMNPTVSAG